ncbi:plasmid transfer protein TraA [Kitasatospora indigofera]|uniref:plasmid transfer protein TraA n=1 Tax=Kitasatospora indigofera TaxID=67307 RepID=UPI00364EE050
MSVPPQNNPNQQWFQAGQNYVRPPQPPQGSTGAGGGTRSRGAGRPAGGQGGDGGNQYHFHYNSGGAKPGSGGARTPGAGGIGQANPGAQGGGQRGGGRTHSPLGDPEFFTNADIRNYCENARAAFLQLSFELAMAAEVLQAVLKEVPDPDGRPFSGQMRARRVAKHLKKTADDAKDAAKNAARTYASFQREFDPELNRSGRPRPPRRSFDFGA